MAPKVTHDPQYLDQHHQRISEFAAEYFDDDDERGAFIDTLLERRGYVQTAGWSLPPESSGQPGPGGTGPAAPGRSRSPYFKQR